MDVIARRAFERPDVEANRAGGNPRQHGSCLAHGAKWSQDGHDAIAFGSGGSVTELSVTGRYRGGGDGVSVELLTLSRCSILLIFEKLMYWSKLNQRGGRQPGGLAIGTMLSGRTWQTGGHHAALLF